MHPCFLSEDPIDSNSVMASLSGLEGFEGFDAAGFSSFASQTSSQSRYLYVGADPVGYTDPTGLDRVPTPPPPARPPAPGLMPAPRLPNFTAPGLRPLPMPVNPRYLVPVLGPRPQLPAPKPGPAIGCGAAFRICLQYCRCLPHPAAKAGCIAVCTAIWIACVSSGG